MALVGHLACVHDVHEKYPCKTGCIVASIVSLELKLSLFWDGACEAGNTRTQSILSICHQGMRSTTNACFRSYTEPCMLIILIS